MRTALRLGAAVTALCLSGAATAPLASQEPAPLRLDLNIPTLRLVVYEGDRVLRTYGVAVGENKFPTPTGEFEVQSAEWNPWWRPPAREWAAKDKITPPGPTNPMGRVKLFFTNLYYIHGTPDEKSIGSAASHGCVRMRNADVIALARLLHERGAAAPNLNIDNILKGRKTSTARLRQAIPLVIRYDPVVVDAGEIRIYPDLYGRRAVHAEGVYQALISAGYDTGGINRADVGALLKRAESRKGVFKVAVADAFSAAAPAGSVSSDASQR
jgi:murein L,D-transpeptidase YcbB/YkuD